MVPSGIRMGTPALASRGFQEEDFVKVAEYFDAAVKLALKIKADAKGVGEPLKGLQSGKAVDFLDPLYSLESSESEFSSSILRFSYSSLKTPPSVYDYDMNAGSSILKKIETVLGGFDATKYVTERKWATASDGIQIPLSIVYRKDLVKLNGSDPLLLYGYGKTTSGS